MWRSRLVSSRPDRAKVFPHEPIDRLIGPLERFVHVEAASGIVLLACTAAALVLANSGLAERFVGLWDTRLTLGVGSFQMSHSLRHWINDALMAVFFFVIGLEVKREIVLGELRELRSAALPIVAATGGMVGPALVYLALQKGQPGVRGWGIPMATDIAFVVGCMALLQSRVPPALRVLLLSIAIADDIGAILVIAIGYTAGIHGIALALGLVGLAAVYALRRLGVRGLLVYTLAGGLVWLAFHESGVHATIAGVALGLMTPARGYVGEEALRGVLADAEQAAGDVRRLRNVARETVSPLEYLEATIHPWVGFAIMPLFALANAGVAFRFADLGHPVALAVGAGLVLGKPAGILLASWLAIRAGIARRPEGVTWTVFAGGGLLTGIGFTMSLFISGLALEGASLDAAKVGILAGSGVAALLGMCVLARVLPARAPSAGR
jgi:Na+:H+ antiporter, NhaA family